MSSLGVFCYNKHHEQKQLAGERIYFSWQVAVHHEGKREAGAEADRGGVLCTGCPPWLPQPALLSYPPTVRWAYTSAVNQGNAPQTCPQAGLDGGSSQ